MNARIFYAVAPLAVLLSAGANAQSVITTERPLDLTQSQQTTVYRTIVRESAVPQTRNTVTRKQSKQIIRKPSGNVVRTTTTERIVTRPSRAVAAPVAQQQVITQPQTTTLVTADPLDLTQDQRTVVYRTLAQPSLQAAPVVTERLVPPPAPRPYVTTEPIVTAPQFEQRVITVPQTTGVGTVVTEPVATEIVIGSRIPASVPLYAMPAAAAATAPSIGGYQYALIGDRVYLVDPRDGIVVAMLYQ